MKVKSICFCKTALNLVLVIVFFNFNISYLRADVISDQLFDDRMSVRITMDLENTPLREVLKMLSVQAKLNFISSEAVASRNITLYLDNVALNDALDKIFAANNLTYVLDSESNIFTVKDLGALSIDTQTKVYFLQYASATNSKSAVGIGGLKEALTSTLSSNGKIIEDASTNSLIITDVISRFPLIEQLIAKLDVPVPQVMIEVEILDVDKADVDTLGFKFGGDTSSPTVVTFSGNSMGQTYFPFHSDTYAKTTTPKTPPTPGSWSFAGLQVALDFLSTRATTKFLARPKIFVLNNETAELKLSSDEAVGMTTITQGQGTAAITTTSAERAQTGVILKVTPQISMATGEVTMSLEPIIRETVASNIGTGTRDTDERSLKSAVRVKDGETIIMGGLLRRKSAVSKTSLPFLGNIPIVGMLFRHKEDGPRRDREILVFITPRIMKMPGENISGGLKFNYPRVISEREQEPFIDPRRGEIVSRALRIYE